MSMTPPSPETKAWFKDFVSRYPDVVVRPMFGHAAAMVNGRMAAGTFGDDLTLRLSDADAAEAAVQLGATPFEPAPGRRMTGYYLVPAAARDNEALLREWLERALAFTAGLPAKKR